MGWRAAAAKRRRRPSSRRRTALELSNSCVALRYVRCIALFVENYVCLRLLS